MSTVPPAPSGPVNGVMPSAPAPGTCGLDRPAFCETFDKPYMGGGRNGQLDPRRWSVARITGDVNAGQGYYNKWIPTTASRCGSQVMALAPQDYVLCGTDSGDSHLTEVFHDNGSYVVSSFRARQLFDFAGRTGNVAFEVDAKTAGSHGWWLEVWLTDQPIPAPHSEQDRPFSRNAIGIRFNNECPSQGGYIPGGSLDGSPKTAVNELIVVRDHHQLSLTSAGITRTARDCMAVKPGIRNRLRIAIDQKHVEVWATDFDGKGPKLIAKYENLDLQFSRAYVHFQHTDYNASKAGSGVPQNQTYNWDNIGFDGPLLPVADLYAVPDAMTPGSSGSVSLGYPIKAAGLARGPLTVENVDPKGYSEAFLTFNLNSAWDVKYRVNGGDWHAFTVPRFDKEQSAWNGVVAPIGLGELRPGTNTVDFATGPTTTDIKAVSNIDLVMQ